MSKLKYLILGLLFIFISCNEFDSSKNILISERIDYDFFEFNLKDSLFQDTLKQFDDNGNLILFQIWDKGEIIKTNYYYSKPRDLVHYWIGDSLTADYIDSHDSSFIIYPFSKSILKLYDKYKRNSNAIVYKDSINKLNVLNVPDKIYAIGLAGGAWVDTQHFTMIPKRNIGDTIKLHFFYNGGFQSVEPIKLIIR